MNYSAEKIQSIIKGGKLFTYHQGKSFLEVYWSHPDLPKNTCYVFTFTTMNHEFVGVKPAQPRFIPVKYKPKVYRPIVEGLMKRLSES